MTPWGHLAAALPLAGGIYLAAGPAAAAAAGAASVLVDLDHLADYLWLHRGRFHPLGFYRDYRRHHTPKLVLALHSWELALMALGAAWLWAGPPWLLALAGGWLYHLACDQAANRVGAPFYLLSFRALRGFERSRLPCPQAQAGLDTQGKHD